MALHADELRCRAIRERLELAPDELDERRVVALESPAERTADEAAPDRALGARRGTPVRVRAGERAPLDRRHDEPEAAQLGQIGRAVREGDGRGRGVVDAREETAELGIDGREQRCGGVRRRRDDDRVGDELLVPEVEPPAASVSRDARDRGAQPGDALRQAARERVDERPHARGRRDEEGVARAGAVGPTGRSAEPEDQAPVPPLDLAEARHGRVERQALDVGRGDAARERLRGALERLASEAAADERAEALVALRGRAWQDEVERHAELAAPSEERRRGDRADVRRREEEEALGKWRRAGRGGRQVRRHPRACRRARRRCASQSDRRRFSVRSSRRRLDRETRGPLRRDRAAEAVAGLEEDDTRDAALDEPVRGGEPARPPPITATRVIAPPRRRPRPACG
jgi:hypothetical protein